MATHSTVLAWRIPWTEEPGRLQSMGSWRVGHDGATKEPHKDQSPASVRTGVRLCQSTGYSVDQSRLYWGP